MNLNDVLKKLNKEEVFEIQIPRSMERQVGRVAYALSLMNRDGSMRQAPLTSPPVRAAAQEAR